MIDFYYAPTPNGWKVAAMLEECNLDYKTHLLDLHSGDQFNPRYLRISPNAKIPAIVDHSPPSHFNQKSVSVFESGAILFYLAEKTRQLSAPNSILRKEMLEWLFWQASNQGPMAGQLSHFKNYAPIQNQAYGFQRYKGEYKRNLAVLEKRLIDREFIIGEYSICDIMAFPWVFIAKPLSISLNAFPNVNAWRFMIKDRPAIIKAINLHKNVQLNQDINVDNNSILFNQSDLHFKKTKKKLNKNSLGSKHKGY